MGRAQRALVLGQVLFFGGMLTCLALRPEGLSTNDGLSYYGTFADTITPYAVALLGCALCLHLAARTLGRGQSSPAEDADALPQVCRALEVFAVLLVGVLLTPYTVAPWVEDLHMALGAVLFAGQLALSGWLTSRLRYPPWAVLLVLAQLAAGIACAAYLTPRQGLLTQSQLAFQLAFGWFLVRVLPALALSAQPAGTVPEPPAPP